MLLQVLDMFPYYWNEILCNNSFKIGFQENVRYAAPRDSLPSEEFELTANTPQAHMKPHGKLILKLLIYLTAHS